MHQITLTAENHGYEIRLENRTFTEGGKKEISETIATLAVITDYNAAREAFDTVNNLVSVLEKNEIVKDVFRHRILK